MTAADILKKNIEDLDGNIYELESEIQNAVTVCVEVHKKKQINKLITRRQRYAKLAERLKIEVDALRPLNFYK